MQTPQEYRVELDIYNGPLDLLLYLIRRDELDISDISISKITDSYMTYLHMLRDMRDQHGLDINVAGDFLVVAATLMEIKSAMLLPRAEVVEGVADAAADLTDPRYELVQQLLEYKRFKDAAARLEQQQETHHQRFARVPAVRPEDLANSEPPPLDLEEVQVWDLLRAFSRLMNEVGQRKMTHDVVYDDTPIDLHAADIEDRLNREGKLTLRVLLVGRTNRSEMVGVFLALLELIREKKILVMQDAVDSELEIIPAPEEHRRTYIGASLHLSPENEGEAPADQAPPSLAQPAGAAPGETTADVDPAS